jgi:hypothetical protein
MKSEAIFPDCGGDHYDTIAPQEEQRGLTPAPAGKNSYFALQRYVPRTFSINLRLYNGAYFEVI